MTDGIYLHIPFCRIKCPYCDFNTYTGMQERIPSYVESLVAEIERRAEQEGTSGGGPVRSIYFGGGTPSLLSPAQVDLLLETIRSHLRQSETVEVTLEANPGTIDVERLRNYREVGVNRLTLGVQTFSQELLQGLGRLHSVEESLQAIDDAGRAGYDDLNIDLMFGLSQQRAEDWEADLSRAVSLPVSHLSLYNLTIEANTPFAQFRDEGRLPLPEEEACRSMYERAMAVAEGAGFRRYEVSNFAKDGYECVHNKLYWGEASWGGVGAGAHGFSGDEGPWGRRWWNVRGPGRYIAEVRDRRLPEENHEFLDQHQARDEALMLGLRRRAGLDIERFERRFGVDPTAVFDSNLEAAVGNGLMHVEDGHLKATEAGVIVVDYLIVQLAASLDTAERSDSLGTR